ESATKQIAAGRLAQRESLHTDHTCVAELANGTTIRASEIINYPNGAPDSCWIQGAETGA
ncbi:MAG: hypothetical protein R8K50_01480, partial [Mariprofundus sp.]